MDMGGLKNDAMTTIKTNHLQVLRWGVSTLFFFLGFSKALMLIKHGIEPYALFVQATSFPEIFKYYGIIAVLVELSLAIGVWIERIFAKAIFAAAGLTLLGVGMSIYSLIFKINSDCGCGLLGENEYGLLIQKFLILISLIVLHKNKDEIFNREATKGD